MHPLRLFIQSTIPAIHPVLQYIHSVSEYVSLSMTRIQSSQLNMHT